MHSRSFFRWTFIAVAAAAISLFLAGLPSRLTARAAAQDKSDAITQGSLVALDDAGKLAGLCPLKRTQVKAEISGFLSRVLVTQEFENPFADKIEAVYTFPLPQNAAVDDMTMTVGNRTVKGKIMQREEAQAVYTEAKNRGQVASLLNQQRPNIFTQSVANIMPGERVTVTISYVETLKYEDGVYEFAFPMVVGERYMSGEASDTPADAPSEDESATQAAPERVPDAAHLSPAAMPVGARDGHDISIEVTLDAGVPLDALNSATHEIETERHSENRALVRLKNQSTIPNKDFVLRYDVAGRKVEDAVLAHHAAKGGFFTLILQPPERVTVEDVTPKELVFVVDTSGSMDGFPLDKARETVKLALDNLYPQDTFNIITFAGDTRILFDEPVAATPENLRKAKKFLDGRKSDGGTEMMKAIRAALDPSDAQGHLRIACFLTDGQVGNDLEIIAEVQKHGNARVFALGFGSSPNRFLLDKMAEYGRGEVEYVTEENAESKWVARRFHERVRNPLLTDLSLDWAGLAVADVYPRRLPDLFSAEPVIVTGRYARGGRAVIRLHGKMSGRDFVREIPVELPDTDHAHDVLATLWARQRINELMGQDMKGLQTGQLSDELRKEITQLGLDYRLLTQFTSFVAIEDNVLVDGAEPRRVDAPADASYAVINSGGVSATVTVTDNSSSQLDMTSSTSVTTEERVQNLPLHGRSFRFLVSLAPGTAPATSQFDNSVPDQFSVSGQRPTSSYYTVDNVSANIGIAPGQNPGPSVAGTVLGATASGGTANLVSTEAIQEITIKTANIGAEYGRAAGGQINVVTRAGTNEFHGTLYEYFGNDALDANDWFANSRSLRQPPRRLNNFGGTFGGPIRRDYTFFYAAYEGLRLRQPMVGVTDVPSTLARNLAPVGLRSFLNAYPVPNGVARPDGFAEFAGSYANPARHDAVSFRLDQSVTSQLFVTGRYSYATSEAEERGAGGFSLNTLHRVKSKTQTLTAGGAYTLSPTVILDLRGNYSRLSTRSLYRLDDFSGAIVPPDATLFPSFFTRDNGLAHFDLNGRHAALAAGGETENVQRQLNLTGTVAKVVGSHTLKFGVDYRRLAPIIGAQPFEQSVLFNRINGALTGTASRFNLFTRADARRPVFNNLSLYGQDEWRVTPRLTLTYGVRWEVNPAPSEREGREPFAVTSASDLSRLSLAPRGAPLWKTTYGNFAPRVGVSYELSQSGTFQSVLHASFNVLYDLGTEEAGWAFGDSFPYVAGQTFFDQPFPNAVVAPPSLTLQPPVRVPFAAFDPQLKLPRVLQWMFGVQQALGRQQSLSASYVGTRGRRLLLINTVLNPSPDFSFVRLTANGAESDYHSLQLQFNRRLSRGLQALVSYTWAKSLDTASQDSLARALLRSNDVQKERGPSDFDIRHHLSGAVTYEIPAPDIEGVGHALLRNWAIDAAFNARSARPINVIYSVPTVYGFAYLRPDLLAGVPVYLDDATAAGGRRLNPAAFSIPAVERQGTLGRNALRGFPLSQVDFGLRRQFSLTDDLKLQFKIEALNLFNRANFADPAGTDTSLGSKLSPAGIFLPQQTFGESASLAGRSLWGGPGRSFNSFYQTGGPRTFQVSVRLQF